MPRDSERYELKRSPFAQKPTQRDVAELLGESRNDLRRLVNYRESFIVRREAEKNGKKRQLAYPVARLRRLHERLKFHLNKILQPSYLYSPRRGKAQRDNAAVHLGQAQFLTLDLKQFYPSTTSAMVRQFFVAEMAMASDVGGLLTQLCTIDGKVAFGSPLTPVLCALIHREMFDRIAEICEGRGLRYSVWVDDLTVSGKFVPGTVLNEIRAIIRSYGLKSHKIKFSAGKGAVFVTGVGIVGKTLIAPYSLNLRIKQTWEAYHAAETFDEKDTCTDRLLSYLGTLRYIAGKTSSAGRRAADEMNSLRQKRDKMRRQEIETSLRHAREARDTGDYADAPW